ncbi:hypothetical protein J2T17_005460 [Paenibacillus mucilaginosus]|uniref:hypothetical protein n=1 Tax=Paenibacillus mucilaginosus TaxID=61624 RepID=UPI003D1D2626
MNVANKTSTPSIIWGLLMFAALVTGFSYTQLDSTYAGVTVVSKGEKQVVLRKEDGSLHRVRAQEHELRSLTEGEKYLVTYAHNRLRSPFLVKVEPFPE